MYPAKRQRANKTKSREVVQLLYTNRNPYNYPYNPVLNSTLANLSPPSAENRPNTPFPESVFDNLSPPPSESMLIDTPNQCPSSFQHSSSDCSSDSTASDGESDQQIPLEYELAGWCVRHSITNAAGNDLLKILNQRIGGLPKDVRTLKNTPVDAPIQSMGDGEYVHYGLKDCLTDFLMNIEPVSTTLLLNINVDGLPISRSSKKCVWPILVNVNGAKLVMVVGLYCGSSHPPNVNEYLTPFVIELNTLIADGVTFENNHYIVKCRSFICDAPAKSFMLGTKGHTGYSSCTKCVQRGERVNHRTVFPPSLNNSRTDSDFRSRSFAEHHNQLSHMVLEDLPIDMVKQFPLDYMHVVCLGVVKTLMMAWVRVKNQTSSLSQEKIRELNSKLLIVKSQVTREFVRKTRDLSELERYKATEFRLFLLYVGPIVLKEILDEERYTHFLELSLVMRILLHANDSQKNNRCAKELLIDFVSKISNLYSSSMLSYNFHSLTHLADDSLEFGSLETLSAFKFENYLGQLKRLVKKKHHILPQLYNRLVEQSLYKPTPPQTVDVKLGSFKNHTYQFIQCNNFYFSILPPDNCYSFGNKVYQIKRITGTNVNTIIIHGLEVEDLRDFFVNPVKSSYFNIFCCDDLNTSNVVHCHPYQQISKVIHFNNVLNTSHIFIPLISDIV